MTTKIYNVVQVGYGPVSESLALMLGRQGRSVAVYERWKTRYPLPRAVCIDHELYRVLAANGLADVLPRISHAGPRYQWFNAEWKELLAIDWSAESISGGPEVNFVHQPTLEEALDQAVASQPSVDSYLGWEVIEVEQDRDLAHVTVRQAESGAIDRVSARYVVGCDGANSVVREAIGGIQEDRGFEADWLVIDVRLKEGVTVEELEIPPAGQYCNPARPTTIVPAGVRNGQLFRRWEFMRLPGEASDELERESRVWELLEPWAGPENVELVRHKVYNFRSLIAERWRAGRLLIAGDAAHVMPPFMGQGMCSGIRDAWNLAWKLGMVLDGKAGDELLDTYQRERKSHVSQLIDLSVYLGKIICISDHDAAARRDQDFLGGTAAPPPEFPHLIDGLLHRDVHGNVNSGAGLLAPHVTARRGDTHGRFDDLVGLGFVVVAIHCDPSAGVTDSLLVVLEALPVRFVTLTDAASRHHLEDIDGRMEGFLLEHDWEGIIVRPDFYIYGGAKSGHELVELVMDLVADLKGVGFAKASIEGA
jgi:2-polyprenyl-6-methoxyphenol hydroxylase-like FAD-dependent oxidoreductase